MTLNAESVLAATPNISLNLGELLAFIRRNAGFTPVLLEALTEKLIVNAARDAGIAVSTDELQQAANRFRQQQGLRTVEATQTWLRQNGLRVIDLETRLESELLAEKFRRHLLLAHSEQHFAAQSERYARARVSHFAVPSEGLGRELLARINDEGADFHELSRQHGIPETGLHGSRVIVMRCELPASLAETVFQTKPDHTTTPISTSKGWHLFHVHELMPPQLDDITKTRVGQELVANWLRERLAAVRIDLTELDQS